ncbi:MAG TPA: beta-ketoacyl synthase N-terminal-like domain-containing protein, partial [Vicinamibacteria bacterium]|nr:beta-ketoacyl synthase N-terminal-like domain-containing protein [Vicinamibacteria bacterium]
DFFVLHSSLAAVLGSPGQASHAAANAFLDALAHDLRARGVRAIAIGWGAWGEVGSAARPHIAARLQREGLGTLTTARGLAALERLLAGSAAQAAVAPVDWAKLIAVRGGSPFLSELAAESVPARAASPPLRARLDTAGAAAQETLLRAHVLGEVAAVLGLTGPDAVDPRTGFFEQGMDSLTSVKLSQRLKKSLGLSLTSTIAIDHPTVDALTTHLAREMGVAAATARPVVSVPTVAADTDAVAIVGMGCRMPGGVIDAESFWRLLADGVDAVGEVPRERWDVDEYYDPNPETPGKIASRYGAFLGDVDRFDAPFFGISAREARSLDPQQRLLLETSWEALEDAGLAPLSLAGQKVGVFVGICGSDYAGLLMGRGPAAIDGYLGTGTAHSVASGRLSYLLGLRGPSLSVDTACSSSLMAVHLACQSLLHRESTLALAAGVNLVLSPEASINFSRARMLSPDGRSKAFDASANGYVRGEGVGVVVLKRLSDALADGDPILAVVRGSAANQDGRSSGLTVPNGPAQVDVLRAALAAAHVSPSEVGYVEAHGTGTALGDPIEMGALGEVFGEGRDAAHPLLVGSVKSNIGHGEGAAGIAGLLKTVLALRHAEIPRHLHFATPSAHIDWDRWPVAIPTERRPWPVPPSLSGRRVAGVSSFGFSGTNVHVVLESAPSRPPALAGAPLERAVHLLPLSARTETALRVLADRYAACLDAEPLADVAYSASTGRSPLAERLCVVAADAAGAARALRAFARGESAPEIVRGRASAAARLEQAGEDSSLAALWVGGAEVDWSALHREGARRRVALPTYPFERERHWVENTSAAHPLLGVRRTAAGDEVVFESRVGAGRPAYLGEH